ncbi:3'-5'-exoribonuclease [Aureococcus anophagefferens]|nr:3'-5'-exoribonuclease [Aureococcus anophagefferens]
MDAAIVTYARKTRRGAVRKEVAEKYVRDDVGCGLLRGAPVDAAFIASTAEAARRAGEPCGWVVPDTNVVLHQMDVLEHGGVDATLLDRLIICQTVAEEPRRIRRARPGRRGKARRDTFSVGALLADERRDVVLFANEHVAGCAPASGPRESPNDANDRAIRSVAATFAAICGADGDPRRFAGVVLVTDDAACRALGIKERLWRAAASSRASAGPRGPRRGPSVLFVPVDRRFPKVRVETRQLARLAGMRVVVAVDAWADDERYPRGHYVSTLGKRGDKAVETALILQELEVATAPFSTAVLACLPPEGEAFVITQEEVARRMDLRALDVCSIDPPGCRDIDDALHCVGPLANGNYQVGVHIADVTHFVASGSPLDLEAAKRGTSTYLVDRRLDMLPILLTANLCSLRGGVERLAFSALMELTPAGDVVAAEFAKTVIKSRAALTYHQAQVFIDDADGAHDSGPVAASVRRLAKLGRALRAKRMAAGALTLASPEVKFMLSNESDSPTDVGAYQLVEANSTVEEFMLLANVEVAKFLLKKYPALTILRHHPAPPPERFERLQAMLAAHGFDLDVATSKTLADSLDAAAKPDDAYFNQLARVLTTRCMAPAKYFCSNDKDAPDYVHYGLAAAVYTHFTSPIRRYADVVAHRLLAAAVGFSPLPPALGRGDAKPELERVCANLNRRNKNAQVASRESIALYTRLFFKDKPQAKVAARVLSLSPRKIDVLVPRYGIEATLYLAPKAVDDAALEKVVRADDADDLALAWTDPGGAAVALRVFSAVESTSSSRRPASRRRTSARSAWSS